MTLCNNKTHTIKYIGRNGQTDRTTKRKLNRHTDKQVNKHKGYNHTDAHANRNAIQQTIQQTSTHTIVQTEREALINLYVEKKTLTDRRRDRQVNAQSDR